VRGYSTNTVDISFIAAQVKTVSYDVACEAISLIRSVALVGKEASDVIGVLLDQVSHVFSVKAVSSLLVGLVEAIEGDATHDGAIFELLARCVSRVCTESTAAITYDSEVYENADAFRTAIVATVVGSEWSASIAVNLLAAFKDMSLSPQNQRSLVDKARFMCEHVELSSLPSLVYQMLLMVSAKDKGELVRDIAILFEKRERNIGVGGIGVEVQREQLLQTQGFIQVVFCSVVVDCRLMFNY
jgi:hypothetical protein